MIMIRNPRIMIMDLIIVCKETIKYMWNILIVYFLHKHSCYKYIHLKHIKNSQFFIQGINMASGLWTSNDTQNPTL